MDREEFLEWWVEYQRDPWDEARADRRTALLAQMLANRWRRASQAPATLEDFMPQYGPPSSPTPAQQQAQAMTLFYLFGPPGPGVPANGSRR